MKFVLLAVASAHEKWCDSATELYLDKLKYFVKIEVHSLRPSKNSRSQAEQKKEDESQKILEYLSADDFVILFDERGQKLDSIQFSKKTEGILNSGKKRAVFILGGAFGVTEAVQKRAQLQVSLSNMVFNHLIAQTVALEQIYRAFTILKNIPYHNK